MTPLDSRTGSVLGDLSAEAFAVVSRVRSGVVVVRGSGGGQGSGVVWREDGLVLTNDHVVADDRARVLLPDGREHVGKVIRRDPSRDLAALRLPVDALTPVPLADSRVARPGELVFAVGNPLGIRGAVAAGTFGGIVRDVRVGRGRFPEMVQAAVALYPGSSGGPLVDAEGRVLGINAMVVGPRLALAIPSHIAREFAAAAAPSRAYLGLSALGVDLPESLTRSLGLDVNRGLLVSEVADDGPAGRAGILLGDVLLGLDGHLTRDVEDLRDALGSDRIGALTPIRVIRGGEIRELVITIGERA